MAEREPNSVSSVGKLMKGANGRNIDNKIQNKQNEKLSGM